MKIALVNQPYDRVLPPNPTSIGLITYNSATELARDMDVTLYCRQTSPATGASFRVTGIEAPVDQAIQTLAHRFPRWAGPLGLRTLADRHSQYVSSVARSLDEIEPDVVHVMNYWSWCPRFRGRNGSRKVLVEMQCEWLSQKDIGEVGKQLQSVDGIIAVSEHIANLVRNAFPEFSSRIVTAYNGVDVDLFAPGPPRARPEPNRAPRLLFVGRVSPEKGVHTLIDAFVQVRERYPDASLDIYGGRSSLPRDFLVRISTDPLVAALRRFYDANGVDLYQQSLDAMVVKHGLQDRVRFHGSTPHKQLLAAYHSADVLINASLSESFGITVCEAMSCGVPVVVTRVGGMKETVVDGETGIIAEPENPQDLARGILTILNDPNLHARMSVAGRKRVTEQFSWRARAARLVNAYRIAGA